MRKEITPPKNGLRIDSLETQNNIANFTSFRALDEWMWRVEERLGATEEARAAGSKARAAERNPYGKEENRDKGPRATHKQEKIWYRVRIQRPLYELIQGDDPKNIIHEEWFEKLLEKLKKYMKHPKCIVSSFMGQAVWRRGVILLPISFEDALSPL